MKLVRFGILFANLCLVCLVFVCGEKDGNREEREGFMNSDFTLSV